MNHGNRFGNIAKFHSYTKSYTKIDRKNCSDSSRCYENQKVNSQQKKKSAIKGQGE